jgi:hypothetical protein
LLYLSRWSSPEKASEFAFIYQKGLKGRYLRVRDVEQETKDNKSPDDTSERLTGKHAWLTEEGPVKIEVKGDIVLVTESLDQETSTKIEREIFSGGVVK